MKKQTKTFVWEVSWSNPYKPRPEGFPQVILRVEQITTPSGGAACPKEIDECWEEMHAYGYGVRVHVPPAPTRQLPLASKQRIRRRNLWKRLLTRAPLFVSDWYQEQVQAKPEYYGEYVPGEFADVQFARTTTGYLKMVQER